MNLVADFCNRISQASKMNLKFTVVQNSNVVQDSLFILFKVGFLTSFKKISYKHLWVRLKYFLSQSVIRGLFSLSKPSLHAAVKYKKIQSFIFNNALGLNGFTAFLTVYGMLLDIECMLFKTGGVPLWSAY